MVERESDRDALMRRMDRIEGELRRQTDVMESLLGQLVHMVLEIGGEHSPSARGKYDDARKMAVDEPPRRGQYSYALADMILDLVEAPVGTYEISTPNTRSVVIHLKDNHHARLYAKLVECGEWVIKDLEMPFMVPAGRVYVPPTWTRETIDMAARSMAEIMDDKAAEREKMEKKT